MEKRERWLGLVSQCFGGATMICLLFLFFIVMTTNRITGAEMSLVLLLPMPGLALLPLVALIGKGILHCGYMEALEFTTRSYIRGALLGVGILAVTVFLCWLVCLF